MPVENEDRQVLAKSGNRCAYEDCAEILIAPATAADRPNFIGEIAHIKGKRPGSARYDPGQSPEDRESDANKMCLCRRHARIIDVQPGAHTVERLDLMKRNHETWVAQTLEDSMARVGFAELDAVTKAVAGKPGLPSEHFQLTEIRKKMQRNSLSHAAEATMALGLSKAAEVAQFVDDATKIAPRFPDDLRSGFVEEYDRLWDSGLRGDALFFAMQSFATRGSGDLLTMAASVAVLTYLFEKCEVFEP